MAAYQTKIEGINLPDNILEKESRFALGLNTAKNADYIKEMLQIKVVEN